MSLLDDTVRREDLLDILKDISPRPSATKLEDFVLSESKFNDLLNQAYDEYDKTVELPLKPKKEPPKPVPSLGGLLKRALDEK